MKLLILSCNTGEGHNSAAFAVADEWTSGGDSCEVIDAMSFGGEKPKRIVANAYNSMIVKSPSLFGRIYRAGEWFSDIGLTSPVYAANSLYAKKLLAYIEEKGFDAVLCTHLFPMEALTFLRRRSRLPCPCFGILTDYTCVPFFEETGLDGYFSPHGKVTAECVRKGMRPDNFISTGIPVHRRFAESLTMEQARNYLVIPQDRKMYLIMTGGMGGGNVMELCRRLLLSDSGAVVYVLTGRNDTLNTGLKRKYGISGQVRPVVFTEKVNVYMKAADVLLTKPGGISSTEAAVAGVPTVHTMTIPGCETLNADFFSSHGMSVYAETAAEASAAAKELSESDAASGAMRAAQSRNINPRAAADITAYVKEAC